MTEIRILCELDHPSIVRVFETFDFEGSYYIVLELCKGGELNDEIT